jgi:hypothetical protein
MRSGKIEERCALQTAVEWLFDDQMFAGWKRHGNTKWSVRALILMGLIWAWGPEQGLQQRFQRGLDILAQWSCSQALTYQGFVKTLRIWSGHLLPVLSQRLRQRMLELSQDQHRFGDYVLMAIDGTRVEAPRTRPNEAWCSRVPDHRQPQKTRSRARVDRTATQPAGAQIWLTVLWHVSTGLLWDWRQGPSGSSERAHLREMFETLPKKTLLVADAGFQGYDYWSELLQRGHSFLIRVAGQVRLLKGLGFVRHSANIVYLWPEKNRRRQQPPIVLRIEEYHNGRQPIWLVTNLLEELSTRQMADIYRQRWGVEVFFRTFKQTFGRSKLHSHAPHNVELELNWSLLALWCLEFWAARELLARGEPVRQRSTAQTLRVLRKCLELAALGIDFPLIPRLAAISSDGYDRRRKSIRLWPHKRKQDQTTSPQIRFATTHERQAAAQLKSHTL